MRTRLAGPTPRSASRGTRGRAPVPDRIAITGAGVVSAIGAGVAEFEQSLYQGVTGIAHEGRAEIVDFAPQQWLGAKGIRTLDRTARLLCVATHLTLEESRL